MGASKKPLNLAVKFSVIGTNVWQLRRETESARDSFSDSLYCPDV